MKLQNWIDERVLELEKKGETFVGSNLEFRRIAMCYQEIHSDVTLGFDEASGVMFACIG